MYRNVSLKMDKIFPKYYIAYYGLCKSFNKGYMFSNDAVFSGHHVPKKKWSQKYFLSRKLKNLGSEKKFGPEKIWVRQRVGSKNKFGPKFFEGA